VLVAIPRQPDLNFVLAFDGKRVMDQRAAACADGQAVKVLLLHEIRRNPEL
jgi:hypothetical protein